MFYAQIVCRSVKTYGRCTFATDFTISSCNDEATDHVNDDNGGAELISSRSHISLGAKRISRAGNNLC